MKYIIVILSVLLILSCNNKVIKPETEKDEVLAEWNGGKVTLSEFRDIYLQTPKSIFKGDYTIDSMKKELINFIRVKEILKIADSLKLDTVKAINEKYKDNLTALCFKMVQDDSIRFKIITPELIVKEYEKKKYDYHISHILFSNKSDIFIDSLYSVLKNSPEKFPDIAQLHSSDIPTSKIGGDLGWMTYDNLPNEFKNHIGMDLKGKISKPFSSKFGFHIIKIEDIKKSNIKLRAFVEDKFAIINYLEKKHYREIDSIKYIFDSYLFKKFNVPIDTTAADSAAALFNLIKRNGYDNNGVYEELEKKIVITTLSNFTYNLRFAQQYFNSYYPDLKIVDRHAIIASAHSMLRRILYGKFCFDLGYTNDPKVILQTRILIADDYLKYYIYNYIIPTIVGEFESGKIDSFPSYDEIAAKWQSDKFLNSFLKINYSVLDSIK